MLTWCMVALNQVPGVVMTLVLIGLIIGAGALALSQFSSTLTAGSAAKFAVDNATDSLTQLSKQLPTVGVIIGVAIIIVVVLAAFAWGMGGGRGKGR